MGRLIYEKDGHIATITFNRPQAKNALDPQSIVDWVEAVEDFTRDDNLRVAIVTGAGDDAFCTGADLGQLIPLMTGARKPESEADQKIIANPSLAPKAALKGIDIYKPLIAAVNGYCVAGGMEMLQAFDIRIASEKAMFSLQEVKWGLVPGGGSTVRLPRQIPYCLAMEILLTGNMMTADDAYRIGLVNKVVPHDKVMETALEYAQVFSENAPLATRYIKESVHTNMGLPQDDAFARETEFAYKAMASEDAREGPRAFKEKRKPVFKGK